jgi:hypothetical protein
MSPMASTRESIFNSSLLIARQFKSSDGTENPPAKPAIFRIITSVRSAPEHSFKLKLNKETDQQ